MAAKDMYVREQLAEAANVEETPKQNDPTPSGKKDGKRKSKNVSLEDDRKGLADKKKEKGCC